MGTIGYGETISWFLIEEETLFSDHGLKFVANLAEIPEDVKALESSFSQRDGVDSDLNPSEFCANATAKELQDLFITQTSQYARYFRYRQDALEMLWQRREELRSSPKSCCEINAKDEQSPTVTKRRIDFSSRVSLLLLIPLIKSHSKNDPSLADHSTKILFQCLKGCLPNSLSDEPLSCVTGLADLLTGWLADDLTNYENLEDIELENSCGMDKKPCRTVVQNETIIGCLLSLACARLSLKLFVKALVMLQQNKNRLDMLPLDCVLKNTIEYERCGSQNSPGVLLASKLRSCWKYVVNHPVSTKGNVVTCDGKYLYILHGSYMVKLGCGKHGTLRGHVYAINKNFPDGFLCFVGGKLLFRPNVPEKTDTNIFAEVVDTETLKICAPVEYNRNSDSHNGQVLTGRKTVNIVTDGVLIYWLYYHDVPSQTASLSRPATGSGATSVSGSTFNVVEVYLEVLEIKHCEDKCVVTRVQKPVVLKFREEQTANNEFPMPLAMRPVTASQSSRDENSKTSCGITMNILQRTPLFTDGTYLMMVIGHPNYQGYPLCKAPFNRCYSIVEGKFVKDVNLIDVPKADNPKWQSVSLANTGICYDHVNNLIWTSSEDCVEEWQNTGPLSYHYVVNKFPPIATEMFADNDVISLSDCMTASALQIGFLCSATFCDVTKPPSYELTLDDEYQQQVLAVLESAVEQQNQYVLYSVLVLIQTLFSKACLTSSKLNEDIVASIRLLVWKVIYCDIVAFSEKVRQEACHTLRSCLGIFYPSHTEQSAVMMILFNEPEENGIVYLKDVLLRYFTDALSSDGTSNDGCCMGWFAEDVVHTIINRCTVESCHFISLAKEGKTKDYDFPSVSSLLGYLKAMTTKTLEELYIGREPTFHGDVEDFFERLVASFKEVSKAVFDMFTSVDTRSTSGLEEKLTLLHNATKSSVFEQVMPIFLTALCSERICNLSICKSLASSIMELSVTLTKIASLHRKLCPLHHVSPKGLSTVRSFLQSTDKDTKRPFDKVSIPKPWLTAQTVASMHPVCDEYKTQRTVSLFGAKSLYLKFDERCATQYDYDKLVVYAGANSSCTKAGEYGGNSLGYGGRSVVKTGWPKDIVKVNGDTVTLCLEVKSTRERATPDKAVWGYSVVIAANQDYFKDKNKTPRGELDFFTDIALAGSYFTYYLLNMMYCGPLPTDVERRCSHLLKSKLLQRCIWKDSLTMIQETPKSLKGSDTSSKLSGKVLDKLRTFCSSQRPTLRPSILGIVKPQDIENVILSAAVKHYGLASCVNKFELATGNLSKKKEFSCLLHVCEETFFKVDALVRQLQAMAELEKKWWQDLMDICKENAQPSAAFFNDYHLQEDKAKELELLCNLKAVLFHPLDHEKSVGRLIQILESESRAFSSDDDDDDENDVTAIFPKTSAYVSCVTERGELLLSVTIVGDSPSPAVGRSVSNIDKTHTGKGSLSVEPEGMVTRSVSAPHLQQPGREHSVRGLEDLQRFRRWDQTLRNLYRTSRGSEHREWHVSVVEQIFTFVAGDPDEAVSCSSFLLAARTRWRRGKYRQLAILHMNKLATISASLGVTGTHLLGVVVSIMCQGTRLDDLECSGLANDVRDEYGMLLRHIVDQSVGMLARYCEKLIILATTPFTLCERQDVLRSSLILMINKLCSSSNLDTGLLDLTQRNYAWRSFQVLIDRLVSWESDKAHDPEEIEWSGVARQVATVLTSYLRYLENKVSKHDVLTRVSDPLHEVLELLQRIAGSHLGECVLSQPHMIKILLSVITDRQSSPKHLLTALTLLYSALPLTDPDTNEPLTSPSMEALQEGSIQQRKPSHTVIKVLVNKLGELLLPCNVTDDGASSSKSQRRSNSYGSSVLSVYVHNRGDIATHEIVQKVLSSSGQPFLFQVGLGSQMERAITLNRELTEHGFAEVLTDKMSTCLKQATRLAQSGICVSISSSQDVKGLYAETTGESHPPETVCQERNKNLVGFGNTRPYVSGNVAHNMASEVVALLRNLMQVNSAWSAAVRHALIDGLEDLSTLVQRLNDTYETDETDWCTMAQQVLATLCTLGGFKETVRPGCIAMICGEGLRQSKCRVLSVSSEQDNAQIVIEDDGILDDGIYVPKHSFTVPLNVLSVPREQVLPFNDELLHDKLITAIGKVLENNTTLESLGTLFANNDSDLEILRILAEVKTRVFALLDAYLDDHNVAHTLLETSPDLLSNLLPLAHSLDPGERQVVMENHCEELRALFKEYVRPIHHEYSTDKRRSSLPCQFDITREFPIVFGCVFSRELTSVHYVCDPRDNVSSKQPRGALIFSDKPFLERAKSYYWEADIVSLGEGEVTESGPFLSFGFMPNCSPTDTAWTIPPGSCLIHSTGRAVHYEPGGPLSWSSVALNLSMREHDVIGCGWERLEPAEDQGSSRALGRVYFTRNGKRLAEVLDGISSGLYPVAHIQKKNIRVLVNFGSRSFRYQEANSQRVSQESIESISLEEVRANLAELPFCDCSESDEQEEIIDDPRGGVRGSEGTIDQPVSSKRIDESLNSRMEEQEYDSNISQLEFLSSSYDQMLDNGPPKYMTPDDEDTSHGQRKPRQVCKDPRSLLVKSWESKVFPTIRRRFRSEADRRSGLEQIRGALMEGLIDIAISTVEDLYEDSGGLPNSLVFPRIEDIEAELDKTTVQDLRQAMTVQIISPSVEAFPEYAVPAMKKTFGLCGVVHEIDKRQELVLVDVYIRDEGSVVRYWYPVHAVKPQPPAFGRLSSLTFVDQEKASFEIYTELWNCERTLARMYVRSAAIKLLESKQKLHIEKQGICNLETSLDQITLLTGHHLRDAQSDGKITARYIATTSTLREGLKVATCSPMAVFFKDEHVLRTVISRLVLSCMRDGEKMEYVGEKLCAVLKNKVVLRQDQYEVSNVKFRKDVHLENVAVTSVSCLGTADYFMPRIRVPCVELFGYFGRRRLTKDGNVDKYKLTHYPDFAGHHVNYFGDGKNCLNPEQLLPANRFHLRLGSSNVRGLILRLTGIPQELLMCLSFIETFLDVFSTGDGKTDEGCKLNQGIESLPCFGEMLELLQRFLITSTLSPFIRELVFHILAQIFRLLARNAPPDRLQFYYETSLNFLNSLKSELFKLMEKEVSISRVNALEYVLNCNFEKVKFSSYLQSLLELVLAAVEVRRRIGGTDSGDSPRQKGTLWDTPCEDVSDQQTTVQEDSEVDVPASTSSNLSIQVYSGGSENPGSFIPFFASLPVMNENQRFAAAGENAQRSARAQSLRRQRFRERKKRSSKRASSQEPDAKGGEERCNQNPPWFEKLVTTLAVLRHLIRNESCGRDVALDALGTSLVFPSMAWDRVIVVTNIPSSVNIDLVVQGITKASRSAGGVLPDDGIFLEDEPTIIRPRGDVETGNQSSCDQPVPSYRSAVVQLRTSLQIDRVRQRLQQEKTLTTGSSSETPLQVLKVNAMLLFEGGWAVTKACQTWENFLQNKLLDTSDSFTSKASNSLREIYLSCHFTSRITAEEKGTEDKTSRKGHGDENDVVVDVSTILLSALDIADAIAGNLMYVFLKVLRERTKLGKDEVMDIIKQYGCYEPGSEDVSSPTFLHFDGFLRCVKENVKTDKRIVWKAFQACGYDFNHQRSTEIFQGDVEREHKRWSLEDDKILIKFIDNISKNLSASPQRLNPEEIFLESDLTNPCFASLKQFSRRSIGSRFVLHKYLNQFVQRLVLPVVDLRVSRTHRLSTGSLLTSAKDLLFRNTKISELNRVLDLSAQRTADDPSPEISLDPLESIEASKVADTGPQFHQVAKQLSKVSSAKLRVKVATGGDPSFPLRVILRGEQVLGLGGAYRHFMWIMAREVQSSHLGLLIPCPSAAANRNKGKYILRPGPMTLSERQILVFFGQLLGIALRSDIPLALDILPSFWKSILGLPLSEVDLHDADILTYNYIRRLSEISFKEDFERLCMEADISGTRFVFTSLNGEEVSLCPNGNDLLVTWENRLEYAKAVLEYRLKELSCEARVCAIKTGLATVVPIHVLTILNPSDLEIRTCGIPNVDIDFLKVHTTYVAGVRTTDRHIEYFWNALESFSKDEQRKFIKFACNQERLPGRCSCQDGSTDLHVPPYPMKIGPPDGRGPPDLRYIRVETCMFMVKLPRYTTQNVMREKLLYAINCREDPLTDFR
ncbi:probable E3 ubiquitin-protein ligase HECTD4 [Dendronephthya gigantea]|uniref:probable E3 ubiquitin-protein ligase HECTD4 n=1 Tax=Dendronephthya gigantea TaxID=151771 RepID=UPI00106DA39A|nr:probable E3 ubiquitin-protein ligase HECTD4 [Dendronephthya gigantea]